MQHFAAATVVGRTLEISVTHPPTQELLRYGRRFFQDQKLQSFTSMDLCITHNCFTIVMSCQFFSGRAII